MTVADYVAMERGYWDEKADNEEARALTVLYTTQNMKAKDVPFELRDIMQPWAYQHKGYEKAKGNEMAKIKAKFDATILAQRALHNN